MIVDLCLCSSSSVRHCECVRVVDAAELPVQLLQSLLERRFSHKGGHDCLPSFLRLLEEEMCVCLRKEVGQRWLRGTPIEVWMWTASGIM